MLYILKGQRNKILKESDELLKKLFNQDANLNYEKFEEDNFNIERIKELSESHSLFGNKSATVIDLPAGKAGETEEISEQLEEILSTLENSENIFIIRREEEAAEERKSDFNIFAFTDTFGERKKKNAWIMYQKALASGASAEEIFYKIVWQVKTMLLAQETRSAAEADMKSFPYSKAKSFLKNWKAGELEKLSESLILGYHQARRGEVEIDTLIEKTLLKL